MKLKFNAPVVLSFALICTVLTVLDAFLTPGLMRYFAVGNQIDWSHPISILSLFTHVLGHVGFDHLIGNMTFILLLGPIIEEKYGGRKLIIMIILTAFVTGLLNVLFFNTGLLGASGIVFMLILLISFTNTRSGEIPLTFVLVAILFIGKELWMSFKSDEISQFAHIIGGACGAAFGFLSGKAGD